MDKVKPTNDTIVSQYIKLNLTIMFSVTHDLLFISDLVMCLGCIGLIRPVCRRRSVTRRGILSGLWQVCKRSVCPRKEVAAYGNEVMLVTGVIVTGVRTPWQSNACRKWSTQWSRWIRRYSTLRNRCNKNTRHSFWPHCQDLSADHLLRLPPYRV